MYAKYVEDSGLGESVENVCRKYPCPKWNPCAVSAALHFYVANDLEDVERTVEESQNKLHGLRSPSEVVKRGGNCVDKSVFLASLLSQVSGVEVRFLKYMMPDSGHLLLQVCFPEHPHEYVKGSLIMFYEDVIGLGVDEFKFSMAQEESGEWLTCDPGLSLYIGDFEGLVEEGYMSDFDSPKAVIPETTDITVERL